MTASSSQIGQTSSHNPAMPGGSGRIEGWLQVFALTIIIAAQIISFWAFKYFPTTDGPSHVANAQIIRNYYLPAGHVYRDYYQLQKKPMTNVMGHALLALLSMVSPPLIAEKIFLTLYAVLGPLSAWYAFTALQRRAGFLAIVATPFFFGYLFHMGFYNFSLSCIPFFFTLGYWLRHRENLTLSRAVVLTALSLIIYFCHIFALAMLCVIIAIMSCWLFLVEVITKRISRKIDWQSTRAGFTSRALVSLYALLPAILLTLTFTQGRSFDGAPADWKKPNILLDLLLSKSLVAYRLPELWCAWALSLLIGFVAIYIVLQKIRKRSVLAFDGLLLVPIALTCLCLTFNDFRHGVLFVPSRLMLFITFSVLIWIAAQPLPTVLRVSLWMGAATASLTLTAIRFPAYQRFDQQIAQYVAAAESIEPGSTLLPIVYSPMGLPPLPDKAEPGIRPFYLPSAYIAAVKLIIDLRNYEAAEAFFPVHFRDEINPFNYLATGHGFDKVPQVFDIDAYVKKTGKPVDYILTWGDPDGLDEAAVQKVTSQLNSGYIQISGSGPAHLWRRKSYPSLSTLAPRPQ